ncbi:MAG: response regulator [Pseudomonadota bacterium]
MRSSQMPNGSWNKSPVALGELEPIRDADGTCIDFRWRKANSATCRFFSLEDGQLDGLRILELSPALRDHPMVQHMFAIVEGGEAKPYLTEPSPIPKIAGRRHLADFTFSEGVLHAALLDVTDLTRELDNALEQLQLFEAASENAMQGLLLSDLQGRVIYANPALASMTGHSVETLQSVDVTYFLRRADYSVLEATVEDLMAGRIRQSMKDLTLIRSDGSKLLASVAVSVIRHYRDGKPLFISHFRDVTAVRDQERQLKQALIAAEEGARMKSEFLANMSHEIRTPLNGIIGMAQVLEHSNLTAEQSENLAVLKESGTTLMALLNDILDLSKIEAGKLEIAPIPADLRHKLSRLLKVHETVAREKGLNFRSVVHPSVPAQLVFDPVRVRQCLDNLLSNAIKFTESGEVMVAITSEAVNDGTLRLVCHVCDSGPGIPLEKQEAIFEAFQQMDGSVTRSHGGSGLGLSITRQLAELMGGSLTLKSAPGQGSVFTLNLEMEVAQAPPEDSADTAGPLPQVSQSRSGVRVLVVDDNSINLRVAQTLLAQNGMHSDAVDDGEKALAMLEKRDYDIILLDIHMPVMDGIRTFSKIRELPGSVGQLPVIALTADAMSGDRERYLDEGMSGYVSKPIDQRDLIAEIGRVLQLRAAA